MKRWLWLHLTRAGRDELNGAKRYQAMLDRARTDPAAVAWRAKSKACSPHPNRRPNPEATAIKPPSVAEICNDCGTGIVTVRR